METLSRELGVTAATLSGWRDQFLASGTAGLKARETDVVDEETQRMRPPGLVPVANEDHATGVCAGVVVLSRE